MIFQKRSRSQGTQHIFTLGTNQITHTSHYNYLGLKIKSTGNFNHAVNELRDKARRAFYAIKRQCPIEQNPIQKKAIKFWKHLKLSDPPIIHYKALQYQEMSKESKPFLQLIQSFSPDASLTSTDALNQNQSDHCTNQTELHHSLANPNSTTE